MQTIKVRGAQRKNTAHNPFKLDKQHTKQRIKMIARNNVNGAVEGPACKLETTEQLNPGHPHEVVAAGHKKQSAQEVPDVQEGETLGFCNVWGQRAQQDTRGLDVPRQGILECGRGKRSNRRRGESPLFLQLGAHRGLG